MLYSKASFTFAGFLCLLLIFGCSSTDQKDNSCEPQEFTFDRLNVSDCGYISAHRGGPTKGYPENCLETLKFCADSIDHHLILEIDVRTSSDGELFLLHDRSLDRTTTGTGMISKYDAKAIEQLYLVDDFGQQTSYRIPKLSKVFEWLQELPIYITLDVKRGTDYEDVIEMIHEYHVEDQTFIITYSIEAAEKVQRLDPEIGISLSVRGADEYKRFEQSNLFDHSKLIAFTGTTLSNDELYNKLDAKRIPSILGTIGNLDRQAKAKGEQNYDQFISKGIDIIATDRCYELAAYWKY